MEHMKFETPDLVQGNVEKIEALFPNCVTETRGEDGKLKKAVNFEMLRQMLSGDVVEGDEAYEFTWVGKKAAIVEVNKPIRKTLRPCPEESVDWNTTENLYIEGDNLEVLKLLQESYLGKVKLIYIDPPYNTGNDFVYADDYRISSEEWDSESGSVDEVGNRLFKNTDSNGRFHSDWCSMIYPRLVLARTLLSENGVAFISIDECEITNLAKICDEVFGEDNHMVTFIWKSKGSGAYDSAQFKTEHEYVLAYAKNRNEVIANKQLYDTGKDSAYSLTDERYPIAGKYKRQALSMGTLSYSPSLDYPVECPDGSILYPGGSYGPPYAWRYSKTKMKKALAEGFAEFVKTKNGWSLFSKQYEKMDGEGNPIIRDKPYTSMDLNAMNRNGTELVKRLFGRKVFDYPKPIDVPLFLTRLIPCNDSIIMDFFSGSATTAHAVMQQNSEDSGKRKFIMVQLPEKTASNSEAYKAGYKSICEVGKERIRRAGTKIKEESPLTTQDLDIGFRVFKLDDSNMNDVYYSAGEYTQDLLAAMESNVKSDRTDLDLLFGCLLEWGLPLSLPYTSETIEGCTVHTYNDGDLIACFNNNVPESVIKEIARRKPLRAVFRDSSFASSPDKINVTEIFKMLAPDTRVKVI